MRYWRQYTSLTWRTDSVRGDRQRSFTIIGGRRGALLGEKRAKVAGDHAVRDLRSPLGYRGRQPLLVFEMVFPGWQGRDLGVLASGSRVS